MKFEEVNRRVNLYPDAVFSRSNSGLLENLRRAWIHVPREQHRVHPAIAGAVEFFGKLDGFSETIAAALIAPVVFQTTLGIMKKTHIFVARARVAANSDLIDHLDVGFRLAARTANF